MSKWGKLIIIWHSDKSIAHVVLCVCSFQPEHCQHPHQTSSRGLCPGPPGVSAGQLPQQWTPAQRFPVQLLFIYQLHLPPHREQPGDPAPRLQHSLSRPAWLPGSSVPACHLQEHAGPLLPGDRRQSGTLLDTVFLLKVSATEERLKEQDWRVICGFFVCSKWNAARLQNLENKMCICIHKCHSILQSFIMNALLNGQCPPSETPAAQIYTVCDVYTIPAQVFILLKQ